jgi:S1-C subfamily serine protease
MSTLTTNLAEQLHYDQPNNQGIVVRNVRPGSAAERAGIQRYDIIAKVAGKEIKEIEDMHRNIGGRRAGESVELEVYRDEGNNKLEKKNIQVQLDERPSQDDIDKMMGAQSDSSAPKLPGKKAEKGLLGLQIEPRADGKGVVVKEVEQGSRAALAGIQKDDVILEVNRQPVSSVQDLQKALRAATTDSNLFFVERQGTSAFVTIPAE